MPPAFAIESRFFATRCELREARRGHLLRAWRATRDDLHERQDAALVRYVDHDVRVHSRKTDEDDRRELGRRVAVGGEHRDQWLDRSLADNDARFSS